MTRYSWIRKLLSAPKCGTVRKASGHHGSSSGRPSGRGPLRWGQKLGLERLEDRIAPAIAFEDFTGYQPGSILNQNSGSGWAGPWQVRDSGSSVSATDGSLGSVSRITS